MTSTKEKTANGVGHQEAALKNYQQANNTTASDEKTYSTLRAKFALLGHTLFRSNPDDGTTIYFASRWGMVREFNGLVEVAAFLNQIGGKP